MFSTSTTAMPDDLAEHVQALESTVAGLPAVVQTAIADQLATFLAAQETRQQGNRDDEAQGHVEAHHRGPYIEGWLYSCERYFEVDNTPDNWKIRLASVNLDDKGYIWHQSLMDEEQNRAISWHEYKRAIQIRFGPLNGISRPRTEIWNVLGPTQSALSAQDSSRTTLQIDEVTKLLGIPKQKKLESHNDGFIGNSRRLETWLSMNETIRDDVESGSLVPSSLALCSAAVGRASCDAAKKTTSVSVPSTTTSSLSTPIISLPLSSSSSPEVSVSSSPSSSLASSMFELDVTIPIRDLALAVRKSGASNEHLCVEAEWQELRRGHGSMKEDGRATDFGVTWVKRVQFEKSTVQLSCNFSGPLDWLISYECFGFSFAENGPSLLLQLGLQRSEYISDGLLQKGLSLVPYSPTQSLLQIWFRGKLMTMLVGRICSLIGKAKTKRDAAVLNANVGAISSGSRLQVADFFYDEKFSRFWFLLQQFCIFEV